MLEKIFKNKKGDSHEADNGFWRKTLKKDRVYEYHHKKAVLGYRISEKGFYGRS